MGDTGTQGLAGDTGVQGVGVTGAQGSLGDTGAQGRVGPPGRPGFLGAQGLMGLFGATGYTGAQGLMGDTGAQGLMGQTGAQGAQGSVGAQGLDGSATNTGSTGTTGPSGYNADLSYADFYALMPGDNSATIALGADVEFPSDGPALGADILRIGPSSFNLVSVGTYQVLFQVSVNEAGQLVVSLNNLEKTYTVVGRATGTSQIIGLCFVRTLVANTVLTIRNPAGNAAALTLTPFAGGASSVSAHLLITRLS